MRSLLAAFLSLVPLAEPLGSAEAADAGRNVLVLIGDDHGLFAGCYGSPDVKTPHLDRLASQGTRFSHAFATVASCSPSRSVVLSGLFNHTNGQFGLAHAEHAQAAHPWVRGLPLLLNDAGYRTAIIGKYHVQPAAVFPFQAEINAGLGGNRDVAAVADQARKVFDQGDRPFFLYVGFADPHRAGKGYGNERAYRNVEPTTYDPSKVQVPPFLPDRPEVRADVADYYQSVSRLDRGVGLVLDELDKSGKADDTLVIYLSDNGMPFPGAKTTLYDAGIHLPLIIRNPKASRRGVVNDAMASWIDITPTVLDWAGAKGPSYELPGRSLMPILEQEHATGWDEVYASHTFHEITMYDPMRAVRTRKYKLIWNLAHELPRPFASDLWGSPTWQSTLRAGDDRMGGRTVKGFMHRPEFELFDIASDPDEFKNLADDPAHATTLAELKGKLVAQMKKTKDPWAILLRKPAD